ncbi:Phosphopyruvate hydratase, partial [Durusdinium trenchii]
MRRFTPWKRWNLLPFGHGAAAVALACRGGCEVALVTSVCHLPVEWVAVGVRPKFLSLIDVYRPWGNVAKHVEGGPAETGSGLVLRFLQAKPQVWAALLRPEYHTWHSHTKKFHKELSESLATLAEPTVTTAGHVVDLCCGKSLTSALLSLDSGACSAITAVDWREECEPDAQTEAGHDAMRGSVQDTEAYDKKVLGFKGDIFAVKEESEDSNGSNDEKEGKTKKEAECFALDDSDDDGSGLDDDDDEWELEDAYNFDPEKVAELLKKGGEINEEQLVETLQEGMAEAMLMRMNVFEDPEQEALRPDCQGEVDGRMTPPPRPADFEAQSPLEPKALAEKLDSTLSAGRRRSSIGGRRNLNEAVRTTTAKTRKSIACIASSKLASADDKAKIQQAADSTTKRHRMSLCKAAETLDIA